MIKLTDLLNENLNEGRPPTPRDVKDWIESFNNAAWVKNAAGYYIFRASKFALKGIKRELKDSGIHIKHFPKNAYGIPVSQKNDFHWGTNESVEEGKKKKKPEEPDPKDFSGWQAYEDAVGEYQDELKKYNESVEELDEAKHKTYFNSFSGAASEAAKVAEKEGYQIDEDDWFSQVGTGGRYTRSRPSEGDTHRFTVGLLKRGKPAKKALHFQVYGMKGGRYELNAYVN